MSLTHIKNSSESCLVAAKQAETNSVSLVSTAGLITSKTNKSDLVC